MLDVFIGGFAGSQRQARRTADALARYYGQDPRDVEALSFAEAMDEADHTHDLVSGKRVLTHSAGAISVEGAEFDGLTSIASPLPARRRQLAARAILKTFQMTNGAVGNAERFRRVMDFNNRQAGELIRHPVGNLRHLGPIAAYNCLETAAQAAGRVRLGFMEADAFGYMPSPEEIQDLVWLGIPAVTLPGVHDELILYPQETIEEFEDRLP